MFCRSGRVVPCRPSWKQTFPEIRQHILLPWAGSIVEAAGVARTRLTPELFRKLLDVVPAEWLSENPMEAEGRRDAYVGYLSRRLAASSIFEQEAVHAYQHIV
jgi:hypothetical protein